MRRHSPLADYNRALAMFRKDPDRPEPKTSALTQLATNELQLLYLFTRWAGCTDVGYALKGLGKRGDVFNGPTRKQVDDALKVML